MTTLYNDFDANTDIVAVLSSNLSQDAYELYLYPKAKDHSVEHVIKHYNKYFKTMAPLPSKYRLEVAGNPGSPALQNPARGVPRPLLFRIASRFQTPGRLISDYFS